MEKDKLLELIKGDVLHFFKNITAEDIKNFDEEIKYELVKETFLQLDDRVESEVEYNSDSMPSYVLSFYFDRNYAILQKELLKIMNKDEFFDYFNKAIEETMANKDYETYMGDLISLGFKEYMINEVKEHPRYSELIDHVLTTVDEKERKHVIELANNSSFEELYEFLSNNDRGAIRFLPEDFKTKENILSLMQAEPYITKELYEVINDELKNDDDILNLVMQNMQKLNKENNGRSKSSKNINDSLCELYEELPDSIKTKETLIKNPFLLNMFVIDGDSSMLEDLELLNLYLENNQKNIIYDKLPDIAKTKEYFLKYPFLLKESFLGSETNVLKDKELLNCYLQNFGLDTAMLDNIKSLLHENRELVEPYFIKRLQIQSEIEKLLDIEIEDFIKYSRQAPNILKYMPEELKKELDKYVDDLDLRNEFVFSSLSEEYRADSTNVLKAFIANPENFKHIDKKLLEDYEFAKKILSIKGTCIEDFPKNFQRNKRLMLIAMKQNGNSLHYLGTHLAYDEDILVQAVKSYPYLEIPRRIKRSNNFPAEKIRLAREEANSQQKEIKSVFSRTDKIILKEDSAGNKISFLDGLLQGYVKKENNLFDCDLETLKTTLKGGVWKETDTKRNISIKYYS